MRPANGFGQRIFATWDRHEMHVISHQTVSEDLQAVDRRLILQQRQIRPAIVVNEENILAIIATLRYVMRRARNHYSCNP